MGLWDLILAAFGVSILVPMVVWSLECLAALLPSRRSGRDPGSRRPSVVVLVPAHNEAAVIRQTLDSLRREILPEDRVIVIADNCSDETARIARQCGATVLERHDPVRQGKGYALDYGVRSLEGDPAEVIIAVDADCQVHAGAVNSMARMATTSGRPVQASYVLGSGSDRTAQSRIAELAFLIKNHVRPSGLDRLGLPCFLNGSGMAFPAGLLRCLNLANGEIAEDKWLTVDLSLAGHLPVFCPEAKITSSLPNQRHAQSTQRTRWLHGHMECMLMQAPRLLAAAIRQRRLDLLVLFLDVWVPPLSLLLVLWIATLALTGAAGVLGRGWMAAKLASAGGILMAFAFLAVAIKFGEDGILKSLLTLPAYISSRLPLYVGFLFRRERRWVRTDRDSLPPPD